MIEEPIQGSEPRKIVKLDNSELEQLRKHGEIVADTGDFNLIEKYKPNDATTNPTLILLASEKAEFTHFIQASVQFGLKNYNAYLGKGKVKKENPPVNLLDLEEHERQNLIDLIFDHLAVSFGCKILNIVPGFVSTEVDAKLSFDKTQTVNRAKRIIELYKAQGADTTRILIKVATTWQGIKAGQALKKSKIKCNMTLVFNKIQAVACANHDLFLISPFVGRILDWSKKQFNKTYENPSDDPGVVSVTEIFNYFKKFSHKTIVMGASFRSTGQIKELCGCDKLTISPALLEELNEGTGQAPLKLDAQKAKQQDIEQLYINETIFRYEMNRNKLATDLLSAGIRKFEDDGEKLKSYIRKVLSQKVQSALKVDKVEKEQIVENAQEVEEAQKVEKPVE